MNKEKIVIAVIGCGRFAKNFVPLFKAHPAVKKVYVCDLKPERAKSYSETFDVPIIGSFEEALASSEVNAIAIFTQRYLHGGMAIKALKAGSVFRKRTSKPKSNRFFWKSPKSFPEYPLSFSMTAKLPLLPGLSA